MGQFNTVMKGIFEFLGDKFTQELQAGISRQQSVIDGQGFIPVAQETAWNRLAIQEGKRKQKFLEKNRKKIDEGNAKGTRRFNARDLSVHKGYPAGVVTTRLKFLKNFMKEAFQWKVTNDVNLEVYVSKEAYPTNDYGNDSVTLFEIAKENNKGSGFERKNSPKIFPTSNEDLYKMKTWRTAGRLYQNRRKEIARALAFDAGNVSEKISIKL